MCWSTPELRMSLACRVPGLSPTVKYFYWPFQSGASFVDRCVIYVLCLSCFRICSLLPCGHLKGKGWPLGSCLWYLLCFCFFSHLVSWDRCGTWLYWLLIFAVFLTFIILLDIKPNVVAILKSPTPESRIIHRGFYLSYDKISFLLKYVIFLLLWTS